MKWTISYCEVADTFLVEALAKEPRYSATFHWSHFGRYRLDLGVKVIGKDYLSVSDLLAI